MLLAGLNILVVRQIPVATMEWSKLFPQPKADARQTLLEQKQYLLCHFDQEEGIPEILENPSLFDAAVALPGKKGEYLCLFDPQKKERVLHTLDGVEKSGVVMVESLLFDDFSKEIYHFSAQILPFTLIFLLFFIPWRLWVDILLEMLLYSLLLGLFLEAGLLEVNAASLLALLFLFIYSLTLVNYLYSENVDVRRLFFGIGVSIAATMLSTLFLIDSEFGIIHHFGMMLFVGLVILLLYVSVRLFVLRYFPHQAHRYRFDPGRLVHRFRYRRIGVWLLGLLALFAGIIGYNRVTVDLNVLNLLDRQTVQLRELAAFETHHAPSLLFGIKVASKASTFHDIEEVRRLIDLQKDLKERLHAEVLLSIPAAYEAFRSMAHNREDPNILAQFLLVNRFAHHAIDLFSEDMVSSYLVASFPLTISSDRLIAAKETVKRLQQDYPGFQISLQGKVADFDRFLEIFFKESAIGLFVTLFISMFFFLLYCRNLFSLFVSFSAVLFSLFLLLIVHLLFGLPLTIMTLMSLILYGGLVADSFIQLFICYKQRDLVCEKSMLNPIFVSNISILAFLVSMVFVGGILGAFALDMSILLGANLLFIMLFVPMIYRRYLAIDNGR